MAAAAPGIGRRIMEALRGAFARLRRRANAGAAFRFDVAAVPPHAALDIDRILRECVTSGVRHG